MITPKEVVQILKEICDMNSNSENINANTLILNGDNNIDSMVIVQLCIALEDKSNSFGFDFDWMSEKAMSSMNSIFRTPESISKEFNRQMLLQKKE